MFVGNKGKILAGFMLQDPQLIPETQDAQASGGAGASPGSNSRAGLPRHAPVDCRRPRRTAIALELFERRSHFRGRQLVCRRPAHGQEAAIRRREPEDNQRSGCQQIPVPRIPQRLGSPIHLRGEGDAGNFKKAISLWQRHAGRRDGHEAGGEPAGTAHWLPNLHAAHDHRQGTSRARCKRSRARDSRPIEMCSPTSFADAGFGPLVNIKPSELRRTIHKAGLGCVSSHFRFEELKGAFARPNRVCQGVGPDADDQRHLGQSRERAHGKLAGGLRPDERDRRADPQGGHSAWLPQSHLRASRKSTACWFTTS